MALKGKHNHYNVKFLKGYGFSVSVKNSKIATDSVCVTREVDVNSDEPGEFSFEKYADDVYYLQNGFYRFKNWIFDD